MKNPTKEDSNYKKKLMLKEKTILQDMRYFRKGGDSCGYIQKQSAALLDWLLGKRKKARPNDQFGASPKQSQHFFFYIENYRKYLRWKRKKMLYQIFRAFSVLQTVLRRDIKEKYEIKNRKHKRKKVKELIVLTYNQIKIKIKVQSLSLKDQQQEKKVMNFTIRPQLEKIKYVKNKPGKTNCNPYEQRVMGKYTGKYYNMNNRN
eukprot:TRINITY_DN5333_c0_g1_i2.p4 TRINITY_DN5333_c0_g1~~TRINITY_DN5333_c0_g1_i2.p4  ORF type:complete len:204 (-),score=3.42 TRINITY_DN5333_c0_g1_i2:3337-3948(-)